MGEGKPELAPPVAVMFASIRLAPGSVTKEGSGMEELLMERVGYAEGPDVRLAEPVGKPEGLVVAFLQL